METTNRIHSDCNGMKWKIYWICHPRNENEKFAARFPLYAEDWKAFARGDLHTFELAYSFLVKVHQCILNRQKIRFTSFSHRCWRANDWQLRRCRWNATYIRMSKTLRSIGNHQCSCTIVSTIITVGVIISMITTIKHNWIQWKLKPPIPLVLRMACPNSNNTSH